MATNQILKGLSLSAQIADKQIDIATAYWEVIRRIDVVEQKIAKLKAAGKGDPALRTQLDSLKRQKEILSGKLKAMSSSSSTSSSSGSGGLASKPPKKAGPLKYNVPSVLPMYFNSAQFAHNFPQYKITDALKELWTDNSVGSKGMIKTWKPPKGVTGSTVASHSNDLVRQTSPLQEYGFQFLYNPERVQIQYAAKDMGVDIGYELSGQDKSSPIQGTGSIGFSVLINRMIDSEMLNFDGTFKAPPSGRGTPSTQDVYGVDIPQDELKKIAAKGTVYDLEYLFYALVGWDINTQLRGRTPDFGVLLNRKVEVHLGAPIRYVGYVSSLQIEHGYFNENMVPIITTVSFAINIIPDPDGDWATVNGSGSTTTK